MRAISFQELFADAKGTTTEKGAQARLDKFLAGVENVQDTCRYFIMPRADGTFIPVLFLNDKTMHLMHFAIKCGCCVTN